MVTGQTRAAVTDIGKVITCAAPVGEVLSTDFEVRAAGQKVDVYTARVLDPDIIGQWKGWFDTMQKAGIVMFLFVYDDGAHPFDDGCRQTVSDAERIFLHDLVNELQYCAMSMLPVTQGSRSLAP
jgi:hypothetical protein